MERFGIQCDDLGDFYSIVPIELAESQVDSNIIDAINAKMYGIYPDLPYTTRIIDLLFLAEKYEEKGVYIVKSGIYPGSIDGIKQRYQGCSDEEFIIMKQYLDGNNNHFDSYEKAFQKLQEL